MLNRASLQLIGLLLLAAASMVPAIWAQGRDVSARPVSPAAAPADSPSMVTLDDAEGASSPFPERISWSQVHPARPEGGPALLVQPTPSIEEVPAAVDVPVLPEQPAQGAAGLDVAPPPVRLDIPSLRVSAPIVPTGINNATGELAVGLSVADVYWYELGPSPGQPGTALLAGHLDGRNGKPGVFAQLAALEPGAPLLVTLADGQLLTFTVTRIQRLAADRLPAVYTTSGPPSLVLVTCTGAWDGARQRYRENLIVEAQLPPPG
jgi:sortase (surface protein transpeptidase)